MIYINGRYKHYPVETVDQADSHKEAKDLLYEYAIAYQGQHWRLWLSQKSTKAWKERD